LNNVPWWVFAAWFAAAVLANTAVDSTNRLVNAAAAAAIVGAAWVVVQTHKQIASRVWTIATVACFGAALASLVVYKSNESSCTATNAAGQRVVIGTQLTDLGQRYRREHPTENNDQILESLGGLSADLAWTATSIRRCRLILGISGGLWIPLFVVSAVATTASVGSARRMRKPVRTKPRVFVSYSHEDAAAAARLANLLRASNVDVVIDTDAMRPGERIPDFIDRSIRDCDAVVSVISNRSLLSAWVASETIKSFSRNKWTPDMTFVGCYLDEEWFRPEFRLECTRQIDERLQRIEQLLPDYAARRIDSSDLNEEKTRLYSLRNNLGDILAVLRDTLCLDIRDERFDESGRRLVAAIRMKGATAPA
jgi:hypothetical protein